MKKIAVIGAGGKMGQEILQILREQKIKYTGFDSEKNRLNKKALKGHQLVIDFSSPVGFSEALKLAVALEIPFISGTTGISTEQKNQLQLAAKKIPVLWSPNMSLGIALMKTAIGLFARLKGFDFQIEEFHHHRKKDRPSGTALALQETLSLALQKAGVTTRLPEPMVMRAGGLVGVHKAYAVSEDELICIEHQALNRKVFATGAVRAGMWLSRQKAGLFNLEDMING